MGPYVYQSRNTIFFFLKKAELKKKNKLDFKNCVIEKKFENKTELKKLVPFQYNFQVTEKADFDQKNS